MGTTTNATTPTPSIAAASLTPAAVAAINVLMAPVFAYLAALKQPNANVQTAVQGLPSLEFTEAANLPELQSIGINAVATDAEAQLQSWQTSLLAKLAPTPAPTSAPAA